MTVSACKNYLIIARSQENPEISALASSLPPIYSRIPKPCITFHFTGMQDEESIQASLQKRSGKKAYLLEEMVRKLVLKHNLPSTRFRIEDIIRRGDAHNCLALRLNPNTAQVSNFQNDLKAEIGNLHIFDEVVEKFPFSIHIPLGYKRMSSDELSAFEGEAKRLLENPEIDQTAILQALDYVKKSPLSQINENIKTKIVAQGFSLAILDKIQRNLAISEYELEGLRTAFMKHPVYLALFNIQSVMGVERPKLEAAAGYEEKPLFSIDLSYLFASIPDPFLKKILKEFTFAFPYKNMIFLNGSRTRGTSAPNSDYDILVLIHDNFIDIKDIREALCEVSKHIFPKDVTPVKARHSIGLYLCNDSKSSHIDLVPIKNCEDDGMTPFQVYDSDSRRWKPCNPGKARTDLNNHISPAGIRHLIQIIKIWNKRKDSRLRSFHIERMLVRMPFNILANMPFESVQNLKIGLGLAFDFMSRHVCTPLIYDDPATCINNYIIPKYQSPASSPFAKQRPFLSETEIQLLKSELSAISNVCQLAATGDALNVKLFSETFFPNQPLLDPSMSIKFAKIETDDMQTLYKLNARFQFSRNEMYNPEMALLYEKRRPKPVSENAQKKELPIKARWTQLLCHWMEKAPLSVKKALPRPWQIFWIYIHMPNCR